MLANTAHFLHFKKGNKIKDGDNSENLRDASYAEPVVDGAHCTLRAHYGVVRVDAGAQKIFTGGGACICCEWI